MAALPALADDTTNAPTQIGVTTNYVVAHRSFRRVDGKLYNIEKSVLWSEIKGRCTKVLTNGTVVRTIVERSESYPSQSPDAKPNIADLLGGKSAVPTVRTRVWEEEGPEIFLVNYDGLGPTTGKAIRTKAIKVGNYTYEGAVIEKWDCGTPNVVPVIVTNPPPAQPSTNRQSSNPPIAR